MGHKDGGTANQPVDMKLSIMKPIGAKWVIEASDYIKSHLDMVSRILAYLTFLKVSQCMWIVL